MDPRAEAAVLVDDLFGGVVRTLQDWRASAEPVLAAGGDRRSELDACIESLVVPELARADPLLIGAGAIADDASESGGGMHFAWWLGALSTNPALRATTEPAPLDLSARGYVEYLRDFRDREWYRVPVTTRRAHVTGPYVDHLCTCDCIVTVTMPLSAGGTDGGDVAGVVGADIAVTTLERELLPGFAASATPLALVGAGGRVVLSTASDVVPGSRAQWDPASARECRNTPFLVVADPRPASARS
ncbi:cache domain-containing protein [Microbacterium capsulatum]|uniref:Cache domain-containing protein n=1 Tax=Microbacterium capsulatum TaxID=3041921 RepID=A0ABU0XG01_9MICO|nr:cache domain-containing protein [Microbacterium sp. ASV81]MDQ4213120.1 cache domain-containing protein [Microbacterium sp. ASV81]